MAVKHSAGVMLSVEALERTDVPLLDMVVADVRADYVQQVGAEPQYLYIEARGITSDSAD